jgi:hypothetical protein
MTLATNPTETLFREAGQFNGLSPLDEAVCAAREHKQQLERCQALRTQALATPLSNQWDEQDMATYLRYLDETEATLREGGKR